MATSKRVLNTELIMPLGDCFISESARSVQYRARKQAVDLLNGRLLTRAVLYRSQALKYSKT